MHPILETLRQGDRRSIGASNRVASLVMEKSELIAVLFRGMEIEDPLLWMRCADALEKVTAKSPGLLSPYKRRVLQTLSKIEQKEVRWHVAPLLARLSLSYREESSAVAVLLEYTNDGSSIVKTMAMQALTDIALRRPRRLSEITRHIVELSTIGTPAMKARGRKLIRLLDKARNNLSRRNVR
jgi:hypothetical protein